MFATCHIAVCALHATPNFEGEVVTQMLYGESCTVLEVYEDFLQVDFQGITGWVFGLNLQQTRILDHTEMLYTSVTLFQSGARNLLLSLGSRVPARSLYPPEPPSSPEILKLFADVPEQRGGRSIFGVDAPNFINLFFTLLGKNFPLTLPEQSKMGRQLDFVTEARAGDVAFFSDEKGLLCHAGIIGEDSEIFHPYGFLRRDRLDSSGIYNEDLQRHTHYLIFIKRILE